VAVDGREPFTSYLATARNPDPTALPLRSDPYRKDPPIGRMRGCRKRSPSSRPQRRNSWQPARFGLQARPAVVYYLFFSSANQIGTEETMDKENQERFRKLLMEEWERLIEEASLTLNGMSHEKALFPDPTDRAALEADRNFLLRIRDRERRLLLKIREALARIEDQTFGICEDCGEEISESRLIARPVATLCVECKRKQEREEKLARP